MDIRLDVERIDQATALDAPVELAGKAVDAVLPKGPVKDALHGTWLGHPLHPLLTDLPIGCWTNAMFLDVLGGRGAAKAADRLIALGVLTALPTAASGLADWSELGRPEKRVGLVHAVANAAATALYAASWVSRKRGRRLRGVALSFVASGAATVGGYLGGHLVYDRGAGVSRNAFDHGGTDWTAVLDEADLVEGKPVLASADGVDVMIYRDGGRLYGLADVCNHLGGPLHEGDISGDGPDCVTCPWHGSTFRLDDGGVVRGPAQSPQPAFEVRINGGRVEVRRRIGAG